MLQVEITDTGIIEELETAVKCHDKAHMREKASAILQVYEGKSATKVAEEGLLQTRHPRTVRNWIHRFNEEGFESLAIRKGRGRFPATAPYA